MKSPSLTEIVLLFARARTAQQRQTALYFAANNSRFDEDQVKELRALNDEARNNSERLVPLRPITIPTQACPDLVVLGPSEPPMLPPETLIELTEWCAGWNRADELILNKLTPPGALLLCGPTGTGKTMLAKSLVVQLKGRAVVVLDAHRCIDSHMGSTGERLSKAFDACNKSGACLVIEEIDGIAELRGGDGSGAARENNRVTIALMRLIEDATIPIIATSNRMEALDAALVRRFGLRLAIDPLGEEDRRTILQHHSGGRIPDEALLSLPLGEAIQRIQRMKRREFLKAS